MLCPSRGRPGNITALRAAWDEVTDHADLLVAVDDDDPAAGEYEDARVLSSPRRLGPILNTLAIEKRHPGMRRWGSSVMTTGPAPGGGTPGSSPRWTAGRASRTATTCTRGRGCPPPW